MTPSYYDTWRRYVPMAERRSIAARKVAALRRSGRDVAPVAIRGRKIATTFWGEAWCRNLEAYSDYANRLPRGRTYVRNGSVIDLRIEAGRIRSFVCGSEIYESEIRIVRLPKKRWSAVKSKCAGGIDSLVELLEGSISESVMGIVTHKGKGLFPSPREISLDCSCPDWAILCKHLAATLYGVGARLDHEPALLFALRGVDPSELVEAAVERGPVARRRPRGRTLKREDLSSVFGIDLETGGKAPNAKKKATTKKRVTGKKKKVKKTSRRKPTRSSRGPRTTGR